MEQHATASRVEETEDAFRTLRSVAGASFINEGSPEHTRRPYGEELGIITASDCIVFTKRSMLQCDMDASKAGFVETIKSYQQQGVPQKRIQAIIDSHNAQRTSTEVLENIFQSAGINEDRIFILDHLEADEIHTLTAKFPVVIALGGDDHVKAVSQYVTDKHYFVTVNSDTERSNGVMTNFCAKDVPSLFEKFGRGDFFIEEWPRLEVTLERSLDEETEVIHFPPCLSEVSLADKSSLYTFRGTLFNGEATISVKGSGILFTTGVGSTGWFSSAARFLYPLGRRYNRTDPHGEFIIREPYGIIDGPLTGAFEADTELLIQTSSKHTPEISGDSIWSHEVTAGSNVHIRLTERSIKVISVNESMWSLRDGRI